MKKQPAYIEAPVPENETQRLKSLYNLKILDTPPEARFDAITKLALSLFKIPISTITLVDSEREWFKSCQGLTQREGARAISFCGHALLADNFFIIPNAKKDPRFAKNPMVLKKPHIRFYAAVPLKSADGARIGAFCIKDTKPRKFDDKKKELLRYLAKWAEVEINAHELSLALAKRAEVENKLTEANNTLRLLNKILRHDLLNHLTVIKGNLTSESHGGFPDLIAAADQSVALIKTIGQLEAGISADSVFKPVDIPALAENMKDLFPSIEFKIIGKGKAMADETLPSVIENIISNAKIHGQTKKIVIKIIKKGNILQIGIADFGKGIPKQVKNKLFTEGFKYGPTGNHGLGLYIAKKNIIRYGGDISVLNNKPKGTIFLIRLPAAK